MKTRFLLATSILFILASCGGGDSTHVNLPNDQGPKIYQPFVALGELTVSTGEFRDFALIGKTLFVAAGFEGVRIIDISDLAVPTQIGQVSPFSTDPQSADQISAVAANATTLAASVNPGCSGLCQASNGELRIYDSTDPKNVRKIATISQAASALLLDGALLYTLDSGNAFPSTTLRIFDLTSPSSPRLIASTVVASATRFVKRGSLLYLGFSERSGGSDGIQVVDVSSPANPIIAATVGSPSAQRGSNVVATAASSLYSVSGTAELHIYPQYVASSPINVPLPHVATGLSITEQRVFLTQEEDGVSVFDIGVATQPVKTNTVPTGGSCLSVTTFPTVGIIRVKKVLSDGNSGNLVKNERLVFFAFPA